MDTLKLFSLAGKRAVVTGSSRGIGFGIAEALAGAGAEIILNGRNVEALGAAAERLASGGARVKAVAFDVTSAESVADGVGHIEAELGPIGVLVNNAAVTFLRPLDGFPDRRVRLMMEMHVLGPLQLCQLAIPAMRERGRGWILNVTSVGGDLPAGPPFSEFDKTAGFGIYGTAKAALNRLTKSLAAELYDDGIAVNAAAPSNPVATPGAGTLDLAKTDTEDIELITETALRLCTGDPKTLTGRIAHTQPFLAEVGWSKPAG